jgi:predicted dehydrogenase
MPVRIAIDGCGDLCRTTILPHLLMPDARARATVVAVCDVMPGRAKEIADRFDIPRSFDRFETMLADADCDAVVVVVPTAFHAPHTILAAQHGKHVYVQKPMARTLEEARAVVDAVSRAGVKLVAAPGQTLWPLYTSLRQRIDDGVIGNVYHAEPPHLGWGGKQVDFATDPSWFFGVDGGPMRDHGGYGILTLCALLGPVRRVAAFSETVTSTRFWRDKPIDVTGPDHTVALLDFGRGRIAMLPEGWCMSSPGVGEEADANTDSWLVEFENEQQRAERIVLGVAAEPQSVGRRTEVGVEPDVTERGVGVGTVF